MAKSPGILIGEAGKFALAHDLQPDLEEINALPIHPKVKAASVRKAYLLDLFESRGLLQDFIVQCWPAGTTDAGGKKREWYNLRRRLNEKLLAGEALDDDAEEQTEETAEEQSFAFESDLRDFLAHNLHTLEPGLRLYEEGGRRGVEFAIDGGRIDLLALDQSGRPVVIELKLSRGRNQTLGQLLYYMGWVDQYLGKGKSRGMIVAREIPDALLTATRRVPDVSLPIHDYSNGRTCRPRGRRLTRIRSPLSRGHALSSYTRFRTGEDQEKGYGSRSHYRSFDARA